MNEYLANHLEDTRSGGGENGSDGGTTEVSALVARCFRNVGFMVSRTDVDLATAFQVITANGNRLCSVRNLLCDEPENYCHERNASVAKTAYVQVRLLTEDVAELRSLGVGRGSSSDSRLTARVGELK